MAAIFARGLGMQSTKKPLTAGNDQSVVQDRVAQRSAATVPNPPAKLTATMKRRALKKKPCSEGASRP
ncbi:MAG: hypothetical protein HXX15_01040 [Rhodopseudomonas sp.]|uniref:hypothetical protein n=1 Tax=Rhodopseudomonas sp. TaxID=1078 RepID=UPI00182C587D|nr:hypothetical protein [Rhodopseudomonas sp.]NVN84645.1 hypothetical protein [Rhodopseudomonas sp.]